MIDEVARHGRVGEPTPSPRQGLTAAHAPAGDGAASFRALLDQIVTKDRVEEAKNVAQSQSLEGLKEAAAAFEAFFLQQILQTMRKTVPKGGLIDLGFAGETYTGMLDEALADEMAKAGGIGLGKLLIDQLS